MSEGLLNTVTRRDTRWIRGAQRAAHDKHKGAGQ
jgi:hypothetical protein